MLAPKLMREIRAIELHVRRLMRGTRSGDSRTQVHGMGMNFHQVREYQPGDDVRFIDWKGSARTNKILIKECFEDRNRQVILVLDCSPSSFYGSESVDKYKIIAQAASVIALAASWFQDSVGFVLLGDDEPVVWKAKPGRASVFGLMEQLFAQQARTGEIHGVRSASKIMRHFGRNSLVFLLSDLIDTGYDSLVKHLSHSCEVVVIRCLDRNERDMQLGGLLTMVDIEHNKSMLVTPAVLSDFQYHFSKRLHEQATSMQRVGADILDIDASDDFIHTLVTFLRNRVMRR